MTKYIPIPINKFVIWSIQQLGNNTMQLLEYCANIIKISDIPSNIVIIVVNNVCKLGCVDSKPLAIKYSTRQLLKYVISITVHRSLTIRVTTNVQDMIGLVLKMIASATPNEKSNNQFVSNNISWSFFTLIKQRYIKVHVFNAAREVEVVDAYKE